jgi:hypothetical protein
VPRPLTNPLESIPSSLSAFRLATLEVEGAADSVYWRVIGVGLGLIGAYS